MSRVKRAFHKKSMIWLFVLVTVFLTAVSVYGLIPSISLNSPTSFPVDI